MPDPTFTIGARQELRVGQEIVVDSLSPSGLNRVVFEDEGQTGYLYAVDPHREEDFILDAMHIYEVEAVVDRDIPSTIAIIWSVDGEKAALLINNYPHAVFDFTSKRGFCRHEFPPPHRGSEWTRHPWSDELRSWFFSSTGESVAAASECCAEFVREVASQGHVWTLRDAGGIPAPTGAGGRAMPFWSALSRVEHVIATVAAYSGFEPVELPWERFRDRWLPGLERDGLLVGINWSGPRALGYDLPPAEILARIESELAKHDEPSV